MRTLFKYPSLSFGTRVTSHEAGVAAGVARVDVVVVLGDVAFVVACFDACVVACVDAAAVAAAGVEDRAGDGDDCVVVVTLEVGFTLS